MLPSATVICKPTTCPDAATLHGLNRVSSPADKVSQYPDTVMDLSFLWKNDLKPPAAFATLQDVACLLGSYAHDALARLTPSEFPALAAIRTAFEDTLGLKFQDAEGKPFFRSALVQTLFYGMFSAWALWSKPHPPTTADGFEWRRTTHDLPIPLLRQLFHTVADPDHGFALGLADVLDAAGAALNRVDRAAFFAAFDAGQAVQYFYEPFLHTFDPALRKALGVWYTPSEIVQYMVARVDTVLREELDVREGLADPRVHVLDPGCGTGAYLHAAVLRCAR